jgi:hypothetical protein
MEGYMACCSACDWYDVCFVMILAGLLKRSFLCVFDMVIYFDLAMA